VFTLANLPIAQDQPISKEMLLKILHKALRLGRKQAGSAFGQPLALEPSVSGRSGGRL
tara:strand:+ start:282 stop:455 length:174 start_codon:yes stop_codon:yes gene_type:complete